MKNDGSSLNNHGYVRMAAASPKLKVANPFYNAQEMKKLVETARSQQVQLLVFPELSITGYTCADLFFQKLLQQQALSALEWLVKETAGIPVVFVTGLPVSVRGQLFNCAVVVSSGKIYGVVPKTYLPNSKEFYEKRWFAVRTEPFSDSISLCGQEVPFGKVLFEMEEPAVTFGIEICEDLWAPVPPSSTMVLEGANVIVNLSASNEAVSKPAYRRTLIEQQSAKGYCAYLYASAGVYESTTDLVFSGDCLIAENGILLGQSARFSRESQLTVADVDVEKLLFDRQCASSFSDACTFHRSKEEYDLVRVPVTVEKPDFTTHFYRTLSSTPFVPSSLSQREERCEEIFQIQTAGLAKRLEHTGIKKVYIGVSGGLDSTLALLIAHKTFQMLSLPTKNVVGVTMPGFGTTSQTYDNAITLMKELDITINEIDIKESCLAHFKDIRHDPAILDVTYENVQARERTQILMDLANKHQALVIGTGDLSELALGWCTYNGDHMSMYAVNASIPKTLIQYLIDWISQSQENGTVREVLKRILDTPISPELLPPDKDGKIAQKTEAAIGPYELHDFFLYCILRMGACPQKILFLAEKAFEGRYSRETIEKWLKLFYRRFFTQQFKRSCMPDGPKVGSVSLSPRGDWRMPSDADSAAWIGQFDPDRPVIF